MSAMDKMLAQMLGINPGELAEMAGNAQKAILAVQEQANRIEEVQALMNDKLDAILERLQSEGKSDGPGNDGSDRDNGPGKRSAGSRSGRTAGNGSGATA